MKTLFLLLSLGITSIMLGQGGKVCSMHYENGKCQTTHTDSIQHQCSKIEIESLPPMSVASTPIDLHITVKGTYSIQKSPNLQIPEGYTVLVEDLLTGQYYNLLSTEPYTFNLNRGFNQTRFLLEISKSTVTASK